LTPLEFKQQHSANLNRAVLQVFYPPFEYS
jgi:hypothetical protein